MQARAGDLADREQSCQGRLTPQIGGDAAAEVVGGGHDGDGLRGEVEAGFTAGLVDVWETFRQMALGHLGGVEQHVRCAVLLHHGVDGTGDDVSRSEVAERMEVLHERPQGEVA